MKCEEKRKLGQLWVAVRVERGFITEAIIFESVRVAKQQEGKWRDRMNPDYDETAVIRAPLIRRRARKTRPAG